MQYTRQQLHVLASFFNYVQQNIPNLTNAPQLRGIVNSYFQHVRDAFGGDWMNQASTQSPADQGQQWYGAIMRTCSQWEQTPNASLSSVQQTVTDEVTHGLAWVSQMMQSGGGYQSQPQGLSPAQVQAQTVQAAQAAQMRAQQAQAYTQAQAAQAAQAAQMRAQQYRSQPATPPPVAVINSGVRDLQAKAWRLAQKVYSGDTPAVAYLANEKVKAQQGDWMARQFLTYVQNALNQQGPNPPSASWNGDPMPSPEDQEDMTNAISLVNRARKMDQVAIATIKCLPQGNGRARRTYGYAMRYLETGSPNFGAERPKRGGARPQAHRAAPVAHHAAARPAGIPAGAHLAHLPAGLHVSVVNGKPVPAHAGGQRHAAFQRQGYGGGQGGSGSQGGGGGGGGSNPAAGDTGLSPQTGQPSAPNAAQLVNAARAGDPKADQYLRDVMRAARAGDPQWTKMAEDILKYTQGRPEFGTELVNGHAANLSHSHPLTHQRVKRIAADFGGEGSGEFMAYVKSPYGPVADSLPGFTGQVVGRAQAIQASRFPGAPIRLLSVRAARELGE